MIPCDILFVADPPTMGDYALKKAISGEAWKILVRIVHAVDSRLTFMVTNALSCTPFEDGNRAELATPKKEYLRNCTVHLNKVIEQSDPIVIIAMGKHAQTSLKLLHVEHEVIVSPLSIAKQGEHGRADFVRATHVLRKYFKES